MAVWFNWHVFLPRAETHVLYEGSHGLGHRLYSMLLLQPRVVIFDEPTAHLDIEAAQVVTKVINELAEGRIALLVSHRPDTPLANRAILLERGNIVADGVPGELVQSQALYRTLTHEHANGGLR